MKMPPRKGAWVGLFYLTLSDISADMLKLNEVNLEGF